MTVSRGAVAELPSGAPAPPSARRATPPSWVDVAGWLVWGLAGLGLAGLLGALVAAALGSPTAVQNLLAIVATGSLREALLRTYAVALGSSLLVLVAGTLFIFSWRLDPRERLVPLLRAPLLLHGFPAGLAFLVVFGNAGWLNRSLQLTFHLGGPPLPLTFTVQGLVLFFVIFGLPYLLAYTLFAIRPDIAELEDAARLLGCGPAEAFRRVTLPLLLGPLRMATALAFVLAAGSLSVPMLIGGGRASLLPAEVYGLIIGAGDVPRAAALALGFVVALGPPLVVLDRLTVALVTWAAAVEPQPRPAGHAARGAPRRRRLSWWSHGYQVVWMAVLLVLVLAPLYASFVRTWGAGLIATSWTSQWYLQIAPEFWAAVGLSLVVSLACIVVSLIGALPLALAWRFGRLPGKDLLRSLVLIPVAVPGFLWGLSLLVLVQDLAPGLARTPVPLVLGEALLALPFMLRILMSALDDLDTRALEVAAGLGAGPLARVWRVLLPLLLPAIGMGSVLVFVRSFGESNLALVLAPVRYPTAALWLLQAADTAGIGLASAMDTVVVAVPLLLLIAGEAALRRGLTWSQTRAALPV